MLRRIALALGWLALGLIVFATLCPIGLRPETGHPNAERFLAFFLAAACLGVAYPRWRWLILFGVSAGAAALETAQLFVPGRDAHLHDALVKIAGGVVGLAVVTLGDVLLAGRSDRPI